MDGKLWIITATTLSSVEGLVKNELLAYENTDLLLPNETQE